MISRFSSPLCAALIAMLPAGLIAPAPAQAAGAAAPTPLALSFSQKTIDFLPLWIAEDGGYFKKYGIEGTTRYLPAQEGIPALLTGQEQVAGIGGSDAVSAEAQGTRLRLIVTLTPTYIFQLWAQPRYASADALKGQRIGITSTTGSLYSATLIALKQLGLSASDVKMTPLGGVVNINSSLLAGSIAAALSHAPATYKFKRAGLVDLVDLAAKKIPSVNAGMWVTESYLNAHHDVVQNLVDAVMAAVEREKSDRAFAESEISKRLGVKDKGELDFSYQFYVDEVLAAGQLPEAAQIQSNIEAMAPKNPKVKAIDAADMIDPSFVKNALKHHAADAAGAASGGHSSAH